MRINSKNKGNRNERSGTKLWSEWTGWEFSRVPASGGLRWKKTDDITGDIICTEKGIYEFKFSIEMKFHKEIDFKYLLLPTKKDQVRAFWDQCVSDAKRAEKIPILFMRYNGMKADTHFVVISYELYLKTRKLIKFSNGVLKFNREIVIFNSMDLFNSNFKKIYNLL